MKVLLISPSLKNYFDNPRPPLGLLYIASVLNHNLFQVKLIDMNAEKIHWENLKEKIASFSPDIIAFSSTTPYFKSVCYLSQEIKNLNSNIKIIIGGPHVSSLPYKTLLDCSFIDIGVVGEGENTMLELTKTLKHNYPLSTTDGIVYRNNGIITLNKKRELINNLDIIPFPFWNSININTYANNSGYFNKKAFSIITSRGCPFHCNFCDSHKIWERKVRYRSIPNIIEEIKHLQKVGINYIIIQDDTFTLNQHRILEFCDAVKPLNIEWECKGRVDKVTPNILKYMKSSGCKYISYGIESGNQDILNYIKKGITISQIKKAVLHTKKAGIRVGGFWMMGFPPEDNNKILDTLNLAKYLNLNWNSEFSILVPYPGSDIYYDMKEKDLILSEDYETYYKVPPKLIEPPIRTEYLTAPELLKLKRKYDSILYNHTLKNIFLNHIKRLDKVALAFMLNPRTFISTIITLLNKRKRYT